VLSLAATTLVVIKSKAFVIRVSLSLISVYSSIKCISSKVFH
jgi:hypothetical protein